MELRFLSFERGGVERAEVRRPLEERASNKQAALGGRVIKDRMFLDVAKPSAVRQELIAHIQADEVGPPVELRSAEVGVAPYARPVEIRSLQAEELRSLGD